MSSSKVLRPIYNCGSNALCLRFDQYFEIVLLTAGCCFVSLLPVLFYNAQVSVPRFAVGIVIGRNGEMIKKIQNDAGVRIQFKPGLCSII